MACRAANHILLNSNSERNNFYADGNHNIVIVIPTRYSKIQQLHNNMIYPTSLLIIQQLTSTKGYWDLLLLCGHD